MTKFPYGECECRDGCQCKEKPGPAAVILKRDENYLSCCTRCILSEDKVTKNLIEGTMSAQVFLDVFFEYDPLVMFTLPIQKKLD